MWTMSLQKPKIFALPLRIERLQTNRRQTATLQEPTQVPCSDLGGFGWRDTKAHKRSPKTYVDSPAL